MTIVLHRTMAAALAAGAIFLGGAAPADTNNPADKKPDPNERICERIKEVGSRLSVKKICATRAEWEAKRASARQDIDKAQLSRGLDGR